MSTFSYEKDKQYFSPVTFGPCVSPRQDQYGKRFSTENPIQQEGFFVVFESDMKQLEAIIPQGFTMLAPYVCVQYWRLRNVYWLAGMGYDVLTVQLPTRFDGEEHHYAGSYNSIMWESTADPMVTGRDQIAMNKLVADLQSREERPDQHHQTASNWGFTFMDMNLDTSREPQNPALLQEYLSLPSQGMFNYRYIPDIDHPNQPVVESAVMSPQVITDELTWNPPADYDPAKIPAPKAELCHGELFWHKPTWEQMPVQFRIANTLADLHVVRCLGGVHMHIYQPNDFLYSKTLR